MKWTLKLTYLEGGSVKSKVFIDARYSLTSAKGWIELFEGEQWVGTYTNWVSIEPLVARGLTASGEGAK